MTNRELARFIEKSVKEMASTDNDCTYHIRLDGDFAVYVGWGDGFDANDDCAIHSAKQPTYCICVKVAEYNPYYAIWDNVYMPWYTDNNEVYDTDTSVSPNEDYNNLARYLLESYEDMRTLLEKGAITF